jgi:outer membrane protein assembly factor BamE
MTVLKHPIPASLSRARHRSHSALHPAIARPLLALGAAALALGLDGCASVGTRFIQPYRIEIQQGNFVSSEMLSQLREGMTRDQVKFTLGSPMLVTAFRDDRWDYVFYQRKGSGEIIERKMTVWFNGNTLARWDADPMPSERPAPDPVAAPAADVPAAAPAAVPSAAVPPAAPAAAPASPAAPPAT